MNLKKLLVTVAVLVFSEIMIVSCSEQQESIFQLKELKANNVNRISSYDMIMRSVADSSQFDWQLLSAIAYHESRFTHDIRSNRGAVGLMQIMPRTARQLGYKAEDLTDPKVSVEVALNLLHVIEGTFNFPPTIKQSDRLKVILAAYNAGTGFMTSVRRRAASAGAAYNDWATLRKYITSEGSHRETVAFADNVYKQYQQYLSYK